MNIDRRMKYLIYLMCDFMFYMQWFSKILNTSKCAIVECLVYWWNRRRYFGRTLLIKIRKLLHWTCNCGILYPYDSITGWISELFENMNVERLPNTDGLTNSQRHFEWKIRLALSGLMMGSWWFKVILDIWSPRSL